MTLEESLQAKAAEQAKLKVEAFDLATLFGFNGEVTYLTLNGGYSTSTQPRVMPIKINIDRLSEEIRNQVEDRLRVRIFNQLVTDLLKKEFPQDFPSEEQEAD